MAPTVHVVDPDYDTIVILRDASSRFAEAEAKCETGDASPAADNMKREVHYHVSSRHLQVASSWFKRAMAKESWAESKLKNGHYQILAHDWDEKALLMLFNIFHLRNRQVPRAVSLELLAKIAVLVDYYECGEAIELFATMWIEEVKKTAVPTTYCRDLVLWIWIAWVFGLSERFETATTVAIKEGRQTMSALQLPIPASVSDGVDLRRYQAIEAVISGLHEMLADFRSPGYKCTEDDTLSFLCGSIMFGALTKELDSWSLHSPRPEIPFHDTSFSIICDKVKGVQSPVWTDSSAHERNYNYKYNYGYSKDRHECDLRDAVVKIVDTATAGVMGLKSGDMRGWGEVAKARSESRN
ncbi:hypothetical protein OPT61_g1148 [Boeremia exigua]|uniref:Uncharacterized protein n=1 Tax=Boeremia exigua TaxID=749465 RepID=A0ACC2IRE1_9PLEO|nr:hypothetical protein OPT61_g1148 [Boeremia exigua]